MQIIQQFLGANKLKGLNRIAKIGLDYISSRELLTLVC
jgi:hypothetical protein